MEIATSVFARSSGSGGSLAPLSRSIAARANNSKVTMVDAGLPGSPKKNLSANGSEYQRLAGLDQHAIEEEPRAQVGQHAFDDVVFAGGNAAGKQQQVRLGKPLLDQASRGFVIVARDRQDLGRSRPPAAPARPATTRSNCGSEILAAAHLLRQSHRRWEESPRAAADTRKRTARPTIASTAISANPSRCPEREHRIAPMRFDARVD